MANWAILDDYSLFHIFSYLGVVEICNASKVCKNWYLVASDDYLWKLQFRKHFKVSSTLPPSSKSWKSEMKR